MNDTMRRKDENDVEVAENQTEGTTEEQVSIYEAEIEDLDAALAKAQEEERNQQNNVEDSSQSGVSTEERKPQAKGKPQVESQQGESKQDSSQKDLERSDASTPDKQNYSREEVQAILADNEKKKKELSQKELYIQHKGNELGQLRRELAQSRQQLAQARAELERGLQDKFQEDPVSASNDRDRIKEIDQQLRGLDEHENRAARVVESQTFFLKHVDTEKVGVDEVAEVLRADGIGENYVAQFKANPWEFTTPEALVQMGKRAMDRVALKEADDDRRVLAKHILFLNSEIKKLKEKPGQVLNQVKRNLNQAPPLTSQSAIAPRMEVNIDPSRLSNAELNAALEQAMNE